MFYLLSFILGASVGSFVQVIATRLHVAPIIKGRSKCLSCGEALRVSDLIPIVSFLFLRGKCKYCKTPYGYEALFIEALFGIMYVLLYVYILKGLGIVDGLGMLIFYSVLTISLGVMALYDKVHTYVPIEYLITFLLLTLSMYGYRLYSSFSVEDLIAPFVVALPFFLVWVVTKGKGVGFGDVLLFLGVGAFFGIYEGLAVFIISVWSGALYGIYKKYFVKHTSIAIPFVPFIALAFLVVLFTGIDVLSIAFLLS